MARRRSLMPAISAWGALAVALLLITLVAVPPVRGPDVYRLDGPASGEAFHGGQALGPVTLEVPGQLRHAGLPSDATVRLTWMLVRPANAPGPWGVWFERPLYTADLTWDGVEAYHPSRSLRSSRTEHSLLAFLPDDGEREHQLQVLIRGDYGKGGLLGRAIHGPFEEVRRYAARVEAEKIALVLLLTALACLHLTLVARRPDRWTNLFFGLLCLTLGGYLFFRTDLAAEFLPDASAGIRFRRFLTTWMGPLGLGLATTFSQRTPPDWVIGLLGAASAISAAAWLLPMTWMNALEVGLDVALLLSVVTFFAVVTPLAFRRLPGTGTLALATMVPLTWGAVSEVLVTNGLVGGGSHLLPTVAAFAIGVTAALMLRDADNGERHDRLVSSSVDAMICVDHDGRISSVNAAAEALLGRRAVGSNLLSWVVADDQPLLRAHLSVSPHRPDRAELRLRGQDRVMESVGTEMDDHTIMLLLRDVTRRRELDQGRLQAARMETLAVLVGGIAHDFNNMLGTLLAHVGFLQVVAGSQTQVKQRLERMETTIERASLLTRRLTTLAGGTTTPLAPTDLAAVTQAAADLVRPSLPERARLFLDVPMGLPRVAASAADLEHVLVNLLVNARDAAGATGTVRLVARPFQTHDAVVGVLCAVEDDGPGVPLDEQERIFTPFYSPPGGKKTPGLGLAVARQIVREHQGRLWVEDRPGGGARFCIALHHADALFEESAPLPDGRLLVVVEDEDVLRDTWSTALVKAGYRVERFGDGLSAADWLQEHRPDAVITDVLMPGMNGIDLARLSRALHPDVPVLLLSGFMPQEVVADEDPLLSKLDKPVRTARLVAAVGRIGRRAERRRRGEDDETDVGAEFPPLDGVTWESVQWGTPAPAPARSADQEPPGSDDDANTSR